MACWDIVGKALGTPVYALLGGAVRDRIKAYANGWYTVERTPEDFHAAARAAVAKGYRALKFDPFGAGFYEMERSERIRSLALVEAVRDAIGPDNEILIEMQDREPGQLGGCGDNQVRYGRSAMLAAVGQQSQNFHCPVLDSRCRVLHRH